ncbi:MAG: hypothetical protein MUO42_02075 [Anaerolineaceae bacterium]|nr:hypothetical protein [Anaerolineaceae bacterium]
MHKFFITIKKDGQIFGYLDKVAINLDASRDIVKQAEKTTAALLDPFEVKEENRNNISWKIYQCKNSKYMMVLKTKNWVEG